VLIPEYIHREAKGIVFEGRISKKIE